MLFCLFVLNAAPVMLPPLIRMGRGGQAGVCVTKFRRCREGSTLGCIIQTHPTTPKTHALEIRKDALSPGIRNVTWGGESALVMTHGQATSRGGLEEKHNSFAGFYN